MCSFDKKGLESAYDEERGDGVECKDVCPGLYCLRFERICGRELLRDEVWVTKGTRNSGTTAKTLAYIRMRENRGRTC